MDLLLWLNSTPLLPSSFQEFSSNYKKESARIVHSKVVPQFVFKFDHLSESPEKTSIFQYSFYLFSLYILIIIFKYLYEKLI